MTAIAAKLLDDFKKLPPDEQLPSLSGARVSGEVLVAEMGRPEKVLAAVLEKGELAAVQVRGEPTQPCLGARHALVVRP